MPDNLTSLLNFSSSYNFGAIPSLPSSAADKTTGIWGASTADIPYIGAADIGFKLLGFGFSQASISKGLDLQEQSLDEMAEQVKLKTNVETIQRYKTLQETIGANVASAASRGISTASGTFKAINSTNYGVFNTDERYAQANQAMQLRRIEAEKMMAEQRASNAEWGSFFDTVTGVLGAAAMIAMV